MNRHGGDFHAYLNQAGQLTSAVTRYNQISGLQGPCYYPAGHIFLYLPQYLIHLYTEHAEYFSKALALNIFGATQLIIIDLAYNYFVDEPIRA